MRVATVREIKPGEHRVGITPRGVVALRVGGHDVLVERGAGLGSGFPDDAYAAGGARLVEAHEAWEQADLLVKVKEPVGEELASLRGDLVLFAYLHLAAAPELTAGLVEAGATGIAFETVTRTDGALPLLKPMSEIAGRLAVQQAAGLLERTHGGPGVLLSGVAGTPPARVTIVGAGTVGLNAARIAVGMGSRVTVLDVSVEALGRAEAALDGRAEVLAADGDAVAAAAVEADVLIGAVLVPGARAPRVIGREAIGAMRDGSLVVDVAIDQGGCVATARPTTHAEPTYVVDGVVHACVANLPGAVPRTAALALENVTLDYTRELADHGVDGAVERRPELLGGVNVLDGALVLGAVAEAHGLSHADVSTLLPVAG